MDNQIGDVPYRASRANSVPHNSLSHSANDEFLHGCPSFESPMLSQQRHAAFPSERDLRAERAHVRRGGQRKRNGRCTPSPARGGSVRPEEGWIDLPGGALHAHACACVLSHSSLDRRSQNSRHRQLDGGTFLIAPNGVAEGRANSLQRLRCLRTQ
jgi:hypothetical protein